MNQQSDPLMRPREGWQTRHRGDQREEYEIYRASAEQLGWPVKSFDEWLGS
ncbi:hypothetical protein [Thioalkalivibrio sp. K90mix]|uniref:hypothetical protein n=1 Tax=Thioalkalivibrio sp. (strain K90mix) TaxID=396595 RepID=UPI000195A4C8|nr:hypothetical protein [Thioalkalivibrio sp. K90mix]